MKKLLVLFLFVYAGAYAQSDVTTFVLVRHAEKESGNDPVLTAEGKQRALNLQKILDKQKINAVLSTNFNRTKNTVQPLAEAKGITVQTYESLKQPQLEELISKNKGGVVLICGHSNTTPALANLLLGSDQFKAWDDSDYGNILIVAVTAVGKGTVTHLRY